MQGLPYPARPSLCAAQFCYNRGLKYANINVRRVTEQHRAGASVWLTSSGRRQQQRLRLCSFRPRARVRPLRPGRGGINNDPANTVTAAWLLGRRWVQVFCGFSERPLSHRMRGVVISSQTHLGPARGGGSEEQGQILRNGSNSHCPDLEPRELGPREVRSLLPWALWNLTHPPRPPRNLPPGQPCLLSTAVPSWGFSWHWAWGQTSAWPSWQPSPGRFQRQQLQPSPSGHGHWEGWHRWPPHAGSAP